MAYRELSPPPSLRRHVACLWVHVAERASTHAVVPDACADVISIGGAAPVIVGPATRVEHVELVAGAVIVGARLRPGSVATAFGVDASELVDRDVPLADVWKRDDAIARVEGAPIAAQLAALERVLVARLADRAPDDPLATAAVAWIARHPEAHVAPLARALGLSARQLQRRVRAATGYAPKLLHRILRFQRALVALGDPSSTLAGAAADAGYLDQAHLTREVRALAGTTPRALQARALDTTAMSDFFKTVEDAAPIVAA